MTLTAALQTHFKLHHFRPGQEEVVEALLGGRDVLAVMPTGQGKSLCYQLPSLLLDGISLVISPLISLMKDQVDGLQKQGIAATYINSTLSPGEQRARLEEIEAGTWKLVYVAPERFRSSAFVEQMKRLRIALFAVDEAHCLSQWGHDFRPDYLWLGKAVEALGRPPVGAFTATATPHVREDILDHLGLREPKILVTGFARPNLSLRVIRCGKRAEKYKRLEALIDRQKTGIIYCATRKMVEEVAGQLLAWNLRYVAYHGGMEDRDRKYAQERFMAGEANLAVATNAFGMGIDRRDIRFVAHFELPGSIEAYYQEVGRAGRDNLPSQCELYYNFADRRTQDFFIDGNNPDPDLIRKVYNVLQSESGNDHTCMIAQERIKEIIGRGANGMAVGSALTRLRRDGYIERFDVPGQRVRATRLLQPTTPAAKLTLDEPAMTRKRDSDEQRLERIIRFCQSQDCRQQHILDYFGEAASEPCGSCDRCQKSRKRGRAQAAVRALGPEETTIVRKALSGVARASLRIDRETWKGRFGKGTIINMLAGRRSTSVTRPGLEGLSTFGVLRREGQEFLHGLFNAMEQAGWIEVQHGEGSFPLVRLTPEGTAIMRGDQTARLEWPDVAADDASTIHEDSQGDGDPGLNGGGLRGHQATHRSGSRRRANGFGGDFELEVPRDQEVEKKRRRAAYFAKKAAARKRRR